jgi:autotransporter-associated beta strand protein/T5SS/PEP-CTERM-associated repeat protein
MKRALLLLLFALGTLRAQAAAPAGYWLAWSDECSSNDTDKFDHWLPGARRDAVNTGVAVSHSGGVRTISTFTSNGVHYTGMISTDGLFRERYGFWEASIDYDSTNGMWSAFWVQSPTMGNPVGDPAMAGSEIDICEHRSHNESGGTLHTGYDINNHWDGYGASHQSVGSRRNVGTAHSGFRTYGLLWNETEYQFYYEDTWQWTTTNGHSRRPEFAILSSEVEDGSWAGAILPGGYGSYASPKARMKIDYVRWYAPSNYTIWCGGDTNGSWAATNNWVAGRTPQSPRVVVFDDFTRSNYVTHLDANRTVAGLVVTDPWGVPTISSNTLTMGSAGIDMEMNAHSLTLNCGLTLGAAQVWNVQNWLLTVNGPIGGGHSITKTGAGTLILNSSNAYTFGTIVREGTLQIGHSHALGSTAVNTLIAAGARLALTADVTCPEDLALAGTGTDGTGAMRVGSSADVIWNGTITLTNNALIKLDGNTTLALNDRIAISNRTLTLAADGGAVGTIAAPITGAGWVVRSGNAGLWYITATQGVGATHYYVNNGTLAFTAGSVTSTTWCGVGSTAGAVGTFQLSGSGQFACTGDFNIADESDTDGTLNLSGTATLRVNALYVGKYGTASGVVNQSGGTVTNVDASPADWRIGGGSGAADTNAYGRYHLSGGTLHTPANLQIGAYGRGVWLQTGGSATIGGWPVVGRFSGSAGFLTVSNGTFTQSAPANDLIVGQNGTGTLIVAGAGQVIAHGGLLLGQAAAARGTVNLDGGTLTTPVIAGSAGVSLLSLNGGILRAATNAADFLTGVNTVTVQAGGARFDTAGFTVRVAQAISGPGALVKIGLGELRLAVSNRYAGASIVSAGVLRTDAPWSTGTGAVTVTAGGTLGGTGRVVGGVTVAGTLAPGQGVGLLPTGPQVWKGGGAYAWEIAHVSSATGRDLTVMTGVLDVQAAATNPFTVRVLTPAGALAGFDNRTAYAWPMATAGSISGFAADRFAVDASGFSNALAGGTFSVDVVTSNVVLRFTPPPPPASTATALAGAGLAVAGSGIAGLTYRLESATNLAAAPVLWSVVTNAVAGTNGFYQLSDPATNPGPFRIYRVLETQQP